MNKENFYKIWNEYMEPLFESGKCVWECSPQLAEFLTSNEVIDNITDDEIWKKIQNGTL